MSIVANPRRRRRPRVAISSSSPIIEASTSAASLSAVTAVTSVLSGPSVVPVVPVASSVTSIASVASITSITSALTTLTVTHAGKLSIALALGFFAFLLLASNPFARLDPPAAEGRGLNPLLQDPGLAFHPPTLYFGYVGLSVAFSLAVGALISGRVDRDLAKAMRP